MNNLITWDKVMDTTLSMPMVKVNREQFLEETFKSYGNISEIKNKRPIDIFDSKVIEKVANAQINSHLLKVTGTSTAAGIPGGFAMFATVPLDIAQFYWHAIVLSQELAYIYGYPSLLDERNGVNEETRNNITLFIGVMLGAGAANKVVSEVSKQASIQVAKRLPQQALTKTSYYPIIKSIGKWIGLSITKNSFSKGVSKIVPILGGVVSGGLTFATFKPMANKLKKQLSNDMYTFNSNAHHFTETNSNFSDNNFENESETEKKNQNINLEFLKIQASINVAKIDFELHEKEIDFLTELIENSELTDEEKNTLLSSLHDKSITNIDLSELKNNELYAIAFIESLIAIIKIDNIVKPAEKIYLFKITNELGFDKSVITEMLEATENVYVE